MYKIVKESKNVNGFIKIVYVVFNEDEKLCSFTTRDNAEKFISVCENEIEESGIYGTS